MLEWIKIFIHDLGPIKSSLDAGSAMPSFYYFLLSHFSSGNVKGIEVKRLSSFQSPFCTTIIKVIKEKWGQYFANDHFCTPLCSKRNAHCTEIEQKFQKIVSKSWFIYPIWTIGTYKLLLVGLEFTVKRSNYIKKLAVMFNFCSYPLPWLAWNTRTTMLRRNKASHCFLELNWDM